MLMRELSPFFAQHGLRLGYGTIKKIPARGEGPPFRWFGVNKIFDDEEALAWAKARVSSKRTPFNPIKEEEASS
jgi:hypothetical protein